MKRIKVSFFPYHHSGNEYIKNLIASIGIAHDVFEYVPSNPLKNLADVYVFHWRENKFINSEGGINYKGFIKEALRVLFCRLFLAKVVIVAHNKFPHSTRKECVSRVTKIQKLYYSLASIVVSHSPKYLGFSNYLPHPAYLNNGVELKSIYDFKYFLVFGRLCKYKKIEKAISIFNDESFGIRLLICGPCEDDEYLEELKAISSANVQFDIGFKSNEELATLIKGSEGLLFLADTEDMIVSGGVHLGCSLGKKVFCFRSEFNNWLSDCYPELNLGLYTSEIDLENLVLNSQEQEVDNFRYLQEHGLESVGCYFSRLINVK